MGGEALTPEHAKARVLEPRIWQHLGSLARKRFPANENLADEALLNLLARLEENDWARVCQWRGTSSFEGFVTVVAARCFTDFVRKRFGHTRPPAVVQRRAREEPLWLSAYELLVVRGHSRLEAVEMLHDLDPTRSRSYLRDIVVGVLETRPAQPLFDDPTTSLDASRSIGVEFADQREFEPCAGAERLEQSALALLEAEDAALTDGARDVLERLEPHLDLAAADLLFLRLRFVEGLGIKEIVARVGGSGDPFKRYHGIIRRLRAAYVRAGLIEPEGD